MAMMLDLRYPSLTNFLKISLCPEMVVLPWPLWLRPRVNLKPPMEIQTNRQKILGLDLGIICYFLDFMPTVLISNDKEELKKNQKTKQNKTKKQHPKPRSFLSVYLLMDDFGEV